MRRTIKEAEQTREQILDSALDIFLKKGYSATTILDIVNEAGFSRGAYYWNFTSKEDLLNQMIKREDLFINNLIIDLFNAELDSFEKIEHILLGIITNFYENKRFRRFIEFTWFKIEQDFNQKSVKHKTLLNDLFIEKLHKLTSEAINLNQIKPISPNIISLQLVSLINGIYRLYFISPKKFEQKEMSKELIVNYLNLLKINN